MRVCAEPSCPELTKRGKCDEHRRQARRAEDKRRGNFRERGYDATYDRNRRRVIGDEDVCWLCGHVVDKTLPGTDPDGPTVDHIKPREHGGTNELSNLRLAHLRCNSARGAPGWGTPTSQEFSCRSGQSLAICTDPISRRAMPRVFKKGRDASTTQATRSAPPARCDSSTVAQAAGQRAAGQATDAASAEPDVAEGHTRMVGSSVVFADGDGLG